MNTITLTFFFSSTAKEKLFFYLERLTGFETFISCFLLLFSCTFLFHSQVVLIRVYNCWREKEIYRETFISGQNSSIVYEHFHATLRTRTEKILCLIEKKFRTTSYLHAHWNKIVNVTEEKIVVRNNAREQ